MREREREGESCFCSVHSSVVCVGYLVEGRSTAVVVVEFVFVIQLILCVLRECIVPAAV